MQVVIDLVPYDVKVVPAPKGTISGTTYILKNFLGTDGINILKRRNSYNEPCGYINHSTSDGDTLLVMVTVTDEEIEVIADNEDVFLSAMDYLLNAYSSVGWECLEAI